MLDRLAQSLDRKAEAIPQLRSRGSALGIAGELGGLPAIATFLGDTARDLRRRANILRSPSESPFESLAAYGLPNSMVGNPEAANPFKKGLTDLLDTQKNATPKERAQAVKDYFAKLTPEQQAALAALDPQLVGNLDGVPVNVRFAANRISIQKEYDAESAFFQGLACDDPAYKRTKDRVETLKSFLNPRVKTYLDPKTHQEVTVEVPRQFLIFDAHFGSNADPKASPFPDGRVAEVVGDLETAKNVAFRIPGITNQLDNFNSFSSGGYDLVADERGREQTDTAAVSWLGYDAPSIGDSVDPAKAVVGGNQLNAFRQGISVNLAPDSKLNIFAHSYGSLVTSKALQSGLTNVDTVTFMGSPGLGWNINSVADFHMPNTKFFALRAPGDPVSYTQGHGHDPADFKDITRLATDGATAHSAYYTRRTESLNNLRRVLFGGDHQPLTFTHTSLDDEMVGAAEVRKLVMFLHERVPDDATIKMGADLDPIIQGYLNGRKGITDILLPIHDVLNKHNMLDRVPPGELFNEITDLASDIAAKQAFKAAKDQGAPDFVAAMAAGAAKVSAKKFASVPAGLATKLLEFDRLQNDTRQLFGILDKGQAEIFGHAGEMAHDLGADGVKTFNNVDDMADGIFTNGGKVTLKLGDIFINPTHAGSDVRDILKYTDDTKQLVLEKSGAIFNNVNDAKNTFFEKSGDIVSSGFDTGTKALDKGKKLWGAIVDPLFS
ncbi:hypothetical protein J7F03_30510 [Streptomyces sp. ISL-43]|uniref:alpha/beta hydrolase n=1 Tax=Streptomyces sp. ISL-43 TaxID=2819183 RepID=UPI001BE5BB0E|nr:alpha/beta hydrolase [Streptomyces sp. ISL-43]MBT2451327.1 hypothetical protein [Streptomyces sp. ISL-43]